MSVDDAERVAVPRRLGHLPALDGLRGVAVIAVVVYHVWPSSVQGGYLGVTVFFTLSGFLITRLLVHEYDRTGHISFAEFFERRVRRLLPAASFLIVAVAVAAIVVDRRYLVADGDIRSAVLWHFNWHELARDVAYGAPDASALAHFWSLAIEEQFYLVYPFLCAALLALGGRAGLQRALVAITAATVVAAFAIDSYFNTFSRAYEIAIGCVLAVLPEFRRWGRAGPPAIYGALAVLAALFVVAALPAGGELPNAAILVTTLCTVLVISASQSVPTVLDSRVLRAAGRYSYSLYLWHWPALVFFDRLFVQAAVTAVGTVVSYRLIEQPLRKRSAPDGDRSDRKIRVSDHVSGGPGVRVDPAVAELR